MDMQVCRRDKDCAEEEWFLYKTGSSTVAIYLLLLFQFVIVVVLII
jgi:hypothetical protein